MAKIKYARRGLLYAILNLKIMVLLSNVLFQGARYMEFGELLYKLSITIFLSTALYFSGLDVFFSICLGHVGNYIFNGQFFVVYRYLFASKVLTKSKVEYVLDCCSNLSDSKHIRDVLFIGSLCRNTLKESSDIDIRIFHNSGLISSLFAYCQATKLRFLGLIYRVPVDVFCFSNLSFLNKIDEREVPLHINREREFMAMYPNSLSVFDSKVNL
ncbi:hypothetical protein BIT28_19045 [Photobacterium proteolyticum]|uniref:Uncharacterized protein n=1 Tax=Photobacterium proteolyticum TaxID=1903952 RepID=A0A1Q9GN70_9GAMM|nr:hypothetical protein [Photobacterium proteolyticum]OLQ76112.1 hypothetical protein BIT28_19045 [Photobacterium proteolyticum]